MHFGPTNGSCSSAHSNAVGVIASLSLAHVELHQFRFFIACVWSMFGSS
jgi:hypothetical protein